MAKIEVLSIKSIANGSTALKAYAVIKVGPFTISGVRIVHPDGKDPFISFPEQKGSDGKWRALIEVEKEARDKIQTVVLASWKNA